MTNYKKNIWLFSQSAGCRFVGGKRILYWVFEHLPASCWIRLICFTTDTFALVSLWFYSEWRAQYVPLKNVRVVTSSPIRPWPNSWTFKFNLVGFAEGTLLFAHFFLKEISPYYVFKGNHVFPSGLPVFFFTFCAGVFVLLRHFNMLVYLRNYLQSETLYQISNTEYC
jgi:hypothetical protein